MDRRVRIGRHLGEFALPSCGEGVAVGLDPVRLRQQRLVQAVRLHWPDRRHLHRRAAGAFVQEQATTALAHLGQRHRPVALAPGDGQEPRLGAGAGMDVDHPSIGNGEAFTLQSLQPDIVSPTGHRPLDPGGEQALEGREQHALQRDGQGQEPVEEGGDRRQLVEQAAGLTRQAQARSRLEGVERASLDPATHDQPVELAQCVAGVGALQVVLGPEQALAAGLAGAARDRAERVEAPGDRAEEALLGLHVGGDRPEQRRLGLVRAVSAPEPLDRRIRLPARLKQIMHAQAPVLRRELCMVRATGAARIGKHQDALHVVHEGGGLGEVGATRPALHRKAIDAVRAPLPHDPARAAGDLGDCLRAEVLHDGVERPRHGIERGEPLSQSVASRHRLAAEHRLAVAADGPRGEVTVGVTERLVELHREGMLEIGQHVFARRDVDGEVAPLLRRYLGEAPFGQRLAGRDDLDHCGVACREIRLDRADQGRRLHAGEQVAEEALLRTLERAPRSGSGLPVQRAG